MGSDQIVGLAGVAVAIVGLLGSIVAYVRGRIASLEVERAARASLAAVRASERAIVASEHGRLIKVPRSEETSERPSVPGSPADETSTVAESGATSFDSLWSLNQQRIDAYHDIATSQSTKSFYSSQIATGIGFLLIVVVGWFAANATTTAGAVSAGAVGVVGGGLSAYIGATFMRAQAEASSQLQQFFLQPVEFARVLAAERLLEGMTDEDKSKTRAAMITSMMAVKPTKAPVAKKAAPKKKPA